MYAYGLELLCAHLGTRLDAPVLGRTRPELLGLVDRVLAVCAVDAFTAKNLTGGGAPVALPAWSSLPAIGTLEPAGVAMAAKQLATLKPSALEIPSDDRSTREAARRAIEEITEWIEAARSMRGGGLVCFYY
jgi:hypothetical protein